MVKNRELAIKRGQIVIVKLDPTVGSEHGKTRPALILQNDIGNQFSPTTIVAPITSRIFSKEYPTNVEITKSESGLEMPGTILLNQIRTIDKIRITKTLKNLSQAVMEKVNHAIKASLDLS